MTLDRPSIKAAAEAAQSGPDVRIVCLHPQTVLEMVRRIDERDDLAEEVERLRAALEPFANLGVTSGPDNEPCHYAYRITRGAIRKARAALKGKDQ